VNPDRHRSLRWLLLCALAMALIGMHHVATHDLATHGAIHEQPVLVAGTSADESTAGNPAATDAGNCCAKGRPLPGAPAPDDGHDHVLHLCLAILAAAAVATLLGALRWRTPTAAGSDRLPRSGRHPVLPRPPPARGRDVLTSHCVLRV
jgi:hypothetical protein